MDKPDQHICPVCGYPGLSEPPYGPSGGGSYEICPSCGFEFGYDDDSEGVSHEQYRERWIGAGAVWFNPDEMPPDWDLDAQLRNISA